MRLLVEGGDGRLEALRMHAFDSEIRLQEMIEEHPELVLAGLVEDDGREIWTIGWEVSTSSGTLDLLLLDSTGRLWVVEAKLRANSEIKKQVVGQVLGYASAIALWSIEDLSRTADDYFIARTSDHRTLAHRLADYLGGASDVAGFLGEVEAKIRARDITAIVVVDEIPRELQTLVEFVNSSASFELLALKVEVTEHSGARLFLPTVVGSLASRGSRSGREWDEQTFFDELLRAAPDAISTARTLLDWALGHPDWRVAYGRGQRTGSLTVAAWSDDSRSDWVSLFALWTNGMLAGTWAYRAKHRGAPWWEPYVERFSEVTGVPQVLEANRAVPLTTLADGTKLEAFQEAVEDVAIHARREFARGSGG